MKFSDLSKKIKEQQKESPCAVKSAGGSRPLRSGPGSGDTAPPRPKDAPSEKEKSPAEKSRLANQSNEAGVVYGKAVHAAREMLTTINQPYMEAYGRILEISGDIQNLFKSDNEQPLVYTSHATAGNYLYAHTANVAVLSMYLARRLNLSDEDQVRLGCCAFFHDIGMVGLMHIANRESGLSRPERAEIQTHPEAGLKLADHIQDISDEDRAQLKLVIAQEHERFDGRGYPRGITHEDMDLFAQIIGMADVYEALSHPRSWRRQLHQHDAIKHIMNLKGQEFPPQLVKVMVENLSMYPPGSLVRLSTGEVARVIGVNRGLMMRPIVEIILDSSGRPAQAQQWMDMMEHPIINIASAMDETKTDVKDKKLLMQFEAARWWVEW